MKALDTNILVRCITLDDPKQKLAREREMERRKATRADRTTGCD